jgi:signal transduction histidine kinase
VVVGDVARDARFAADPYLAAAGTRSLLAVPVRRVDRALGVLYFENDQLTDAFTADRVQMIRLLSAGVGISIENSLLFEERHRAEAGLRLLADTSAALSETLDYETTVAKVARLLVPDFADFCSVDLVVDGKLVQAAYAHADPAKQPLIAELRARYPVVASAPSPAGQALRTGKPVLLADVGDEQLRASCHDADHLAIVRALGPRSAMAIPLVSAGRVLGVLALSSVTPGRYQTSQLALAETLGRRVAVAIENARLYREAQEAIGVRDEFLSVASHELRTPVTALKLTLQGLVTGLVPVDDKLPRQLQLAERQTGRMSRLIDEMLCVGRIQSGAGIELVPEPVDLAQLVRDVAEGLGGELARARCTIAIGAPGPVTGRWDRGKLEQVAANLLSNALKFGRGQPIEVAVTEAAGTATLVVRDHGIGIAGDRLPRIFERFERAVPSNQYGGLGLGLYIVRAIVVSHGGAVHAESQVGRGSSFTVDLPCEGPP